MCNCGEESKINCTSSPNLYLELVYLSGPRPRLLYLVLSKWAHIAQFLSLLYLHFFPLCQIWSTLKILKIWSEL